MSSILCVIMSHTPEKYLAQLPLMTSPVPVLTIVLSYLLFIKIIGPYHMKNRPAYNLNKFLIFYNAVQVVVSIYVFSIGVRLINKHGLFDKTCDSRREENFAYLLYGGYCYFLAKVSELLDTVIFVLRKKQNQVTFLHIYHHTCMVVLVWGFMVYDSSYCSTFLGTINSFVHIIMYGYYGLSAIPAMREYLWWKKYLTSMQLIQFALVLLHIIVYPKFSECPPSNGLYIAFCSNLVLFLYLFSKFYRNAYVDKKPTKLNLDSYVCANVNYINEWSQIEDKLVNSNGLNKIDNGSSEQKLNNSVSRKETKKNH